MKRFLTCCFITAVLLPVIAGNTFAATLDFDDLIDTGRAVVQNGYGGLDWDQFIVFTKGVLPYNYDAGISSGNHAVYNSTSNLATVNDGSFSFISASLASAGVRGNEPLFVTVKGYRGNDNPFSETIHVNGEDISYGFYFMDIDRLTFESESQFVMDDFTYSIAPVPEPATALLMLLGLISAGLIYYKRGKV